MDVDIPLQLATCRRLCKAKPDDMDYSEFVDSLLEQNRERAMTDGGDE